MQSNSAMLATNRVQRPLAPSRRARRHRETMPRADGPKELSDEALMEAYVMSDRQAYETLFRRLAPKLHRFFCARFSDTATADDLLQITLLKIHRGRKQYRFGAPVRPWVFTIAARVGYDELRRRKRRPEGDPLDSEAADRTEDRRTGPDLLEQAELAAQVRAALDLLPASQKSVIRLHRYDGLSFKKIGLQLGISEGAVKLRAFRAYEQLRKHLAPLRRS